MKIYVLIPVFNRLEYTKKVIQSLRAQTMRSELEIIVIDDGSTDGTDVFLSTQQDVVVIRGDGTLWWSGAMEKGLQYARHKWNSNSYVLFLNNDTWFDARYIESLIGFAISNPDAIIGSVIYEEGCDEAVAYIGPKVNLNTLEIIDLGFSMQESEKRNPKLFYCVDALSGRGTLFPAKLFESYGFLRPKILPHYLADYEITMRFAEKGIALLVHSKSVVYSPPVYGSSTKGMSWRTKYFSIRSSANIFHRIVFFFVSRKFFSKNNRIYSGNLFYSAIKNEDY